MNVVSGNVRNDEFGDAPEIVGKLAEYLRDNAAALPEGRHDLWDGMFVVVKKYEPGDAGGKRFETHIRYADLQYVDQGGEEIHVTPLADLAVTEDRLEEDDVRFHESPEQEAIRKFRLGPGDFLLLMPEDAHKPECWCGVDSGRKCIVKIPVRLLAGRLPDK